MVKRSDELLGWTGKSKIKTEMSVVGNDETGGCPKCGNPVGFPEDKTFTTTGYFTAKKGSRVMGICSKRHKLDVLLDE